MLIFVEGLLVMGWKVVMVEGLVVMGLTVVMGWKVDGRHPVDRIKCFLLEDQCKFVASRLVETCRCKCWLRNPICKYL